MKAHQLLTLFFPLCLIAATSCMQKEKKQKPGNGLIFSAAPGGIVYTDTSNTFYFATTLYNPTKDTLPFLSMSCSYEDLFLTNTDDWKVASRHDCYKNGPMTQHIPPGMKLDQLIMIRPAKKDQQYIGTKLKIGFHILTPDKANREDIYKQWEKAPIMWSDEIDLGRFFRRLYK